MIIDLQKAQTFDLDFHRTHKNDPKIVYETIENKTFNGAKGIAPSDICTSAILLLFTSFFLALFFKPTDPSL